MLVRAGGDASLGFLSQEFVSALPPAALRCQSSLLLKERSRHNAPILEQKLHDLGTRPVSVSDCVTDIVSILLVLKYCSVSRFHQLYS